MFISTASAPWLDGLLCPSFFENCDIILLDLDMSKQN
jgi:hypothetical protein